MPDSIPLNAQKAAHPPDPPFAFDRCGLRVPAVIVSPWVKPGTVSHAVYDHTSVIRTVFDLFSIPGRLTARDAAALSLGPLLQGPAQAAPPSALPASPPQTPAPPTQPSAAGAPEPRSLDAFARIAAQVHHALVNYRDGMQPHELHAAIVASPDLSLLPGLPRSANPDEARAYIASVAVLMQAHRRRLRAAGGPP
jgi:phospholipase C